MSNIRQFMFTACAGIMLSCIAISCDNPGKVEDKSSEEVAEDRNEDKFNTRAGEKEAKFVVEAVADNYASIKYAQLAQMHSTDANVKKMAAELEKSHQSQLAELQTLARSKSISIPNGEDEETARELSRLADEKNFSKDWCKKMIDRQEESIKDFEVAARESVDNDIKDWAAKALPDSRKQLDELKQLHESKKNQSS